MKKIYFLFLSFVSINILAQDSTPKLICVQMIGKTEKPIFDLYIVDSLFKTDYKFDKYPDVVYTDKSTLAIIFSTYLSDKKLDSISTRKAFGTFSFYFILDNNKEIKFITGRTPSAVLMQKIICELQAYARENSETAKQFQKRIDRINF